MESEKIKNLILKIIKDEEPESLDNSIQLISKETNLGGKEIQKIIQEMENNGEISLKEPPMKMPKNLNDYIFSRNGVWFLSIILISLVTMNALYLITADTLVFNYLRYVLGVIFLIFLPGYSLMKALFPGKIFNTQETTVLSIGSSLSIIPVIGLVLSYTPWGIKLIPVTLFLIIFTNSLAIIGIVREYNMKTFEG